MVLNTKAHATRSLDSQPLTLFLPTVVLCIAPVPLRSIAVVPHVLCLICQNVVFCLVLRLARDANVSFISQERQIFSPLNLCCKDSKLNVQRRRPHQSLLAGRIGQPRCPSTICATMSANWLRHQECNKSATARPRAWKPRV